MLQAFLEFNKNNALFHNDSKLLLAVSGGLDSMVMATLFFEAGFGFSIAHCNFNLRGEESDADEAFVKEVAMKYKSTFHVAHFDTADYAEQNRISIEMAARELRYTWFEKLVDQHKYDYVAVAHHLNDSLETILLNLTRGTGIAGLRGISAKRDRIVRPLLFATRAEIEDYANEKKIGFRQDKSNFSNDYSRNTIRNQVVPLLKTLNPNLEHSIATTIERLQTVEQVYQEQIAIALSEAVSVIGKDVIIDHTKIERDKKNVIVGEILKKFKFSFLEAKNIVASATEGKSGKLFYSPTHVLNCDRNKWIVSPREEEEGWPLFIESGVQEVKNEYIHMSCLTINANNAEVSVGRMVASLDYDKISFPLQVRPWREGDYFIPLGMKGKKKLSDFMIDAKIPVNLKKRVLIVESASKTVWVAGFRIDDRFKITEETKKVFTITINRLK